MTTSSASSTTRRFGVVASGVAVFSLRLVGFDVDALVMVSSGGLVVIGTVASGPEVAFFEGRVSMEEVTEVAFFNSTDEVSEAREITLVGTENVDAVVIAGIGSGVLAKVGVEIFCTAVLSCCAGSEWFAPGLRLVETSCSSGVLVEIETSAAKDGVVAGDCIPEPVVMLSPLGVELIAVSALTPWQHHPRSRTTRMPCTTGKTSDVMAP